MFLSTGSASEMTYIVSTGALNYSLTPFCPFGMEQAHISPVTTTQGFARNLNGRNGSIPVARLKNTELDKSVTNLLVVVRTCFSLSVKRTR